MIRFLAIALFFALGAVTTSGGDKAAPEPKTAWTPPAYAKVVGYRFRIPSEDSKRPIPSGFTLLRSGRLDSALLERQKTKAADLKPEDIHTLTSAINAKEVVSPTACYDPHHIFVFYSDTGVVVAAIEVCFGCTGVSALPDVAEPRWYCHDFIALAKLTSRLGLWDESRTLQQWIEHHTEKESAPKKP
ncbi:hypothetical protein SAMN02745166_03539 [Prosthecobacter debontii]|uniref:Uncharacterized protein n=1 Tax=Prosthecobacter debontii TaxID=48467 RepID=A0A1T4YLE8_9BACT|nr:hypothetical protein [Prosthecobacter debontii]SKB02091.1 hypothetical protein SAMN02745166_03539 [Prosthecobacter debontii]